MDNYFDYFLSITAWGTPVCGKCARQIRHETHWIRSALLWMKWIFGRIRRSKWSRFLWVSFCNSCLRDTEHTRILAVETLCDARNSLRPQLHLSGFVLFVSFVDTKKSRKTSKTWFQDWQFFTFSAHKRMLHVFLCFEIIVTPRRLNGNIFDKLYKTVQGKNCGAQSARFTSYIFIWTPS